MVAKISSVSSPDVQARIEKISQRTVPSFQKVLEENKLKFSIHAQKRLQMREINLTPFHLNQLAQAVNKAEEKGAKESLILMDNLALVVSIKNRTVITCMEQDSLKENVITNIDSAVLV